MGKRVNDMDLDNLDNLVGPTEIYFEDILEASAYTVLTLNMAGESFAPSISVGPEGYVVNLPKPLPLQMHHVILGAIAHDKKTNPAKWDKTRQGMEKNNE